MQAFFGSIPQNRCFYKVRTRCALKHLLTQSQRYFLKWKINPNEKCHAFGLLKTHTYILNFDKTDCDWFLKVCPSIREQQWNAQIKWSLAFQSLSHMTRNMKNDHDGSGAVWAWTCWICVDIMLHHQQHLDTSLHPVSNIFILADKQGLIEFGIRHRSRARQEAFNSMVACCTSLSSFTTKYHLCKSCIEVW